MGLKNHCLGHGLSLPWVGLVREYGIPVRVRPALFVADPLFAWVVFVSVLQEPSRRKGSVETFVPFYRRRARKPFSHIANPWYPVVVGRFFAPL
ncbi:MAG: hypothetical protein H7829_04070 [Magnetococcus sp. THC-1_WYH]